MRLLNYQLIEALNGSLMVVLFWMAFFMCHHLYWTYKKKQQVYGLKRPRDVFRKMLEVNKAEFALSTIIFFLLIRTATLWALRFMQNHEIDDRIFDKANQILIISDYGQGILIVTTLGLVFGVAFWIKVISPYKNGKAFLIWASMVFMALLIGCGGALLP